MPQYVLTEVLKCGFDKPTPIQSQGWPMALKGKNCVGISATGSGKTLAFLLPAMIHINAQVSSVEFKESQLRHHFGPECSSPSLFPLRERGLIRSSSG
jgi:superfamily II DNA/RNA helicase